MKNNNYNDKIFYKIVRFFVKILFFPIFRPKVVGVQNIGDGKVLLAGNHTSILDPLLLMSVVKRDIHFLAKIELFKGPTKVIFNNLGLIPVDRKRKNRAAIDAAIKYLENDKVVLIFPEGTTSKSNLLPFKNGVFKISNETGARIVPFVISGGYGLKRIKIKFLEGYVPSCNIDFENKKLYNLIESNRE